jgi:hypothetical protein
MCAVNIRIVSHRTEPKFSDVGPPYGAPESYALSISHLILGGVAIYRCDKQAFSKKALATEVKM